jgi:V/A-type H+-transporting ATPase subunit D
LAEQGEQLLEDKRSALLRELIKMADVAVTEGTELDRAAAAAAQALDLAKALDAPETVRSAALAVVAAGERLGVSVEGALVLGVAVPRITAHEQHRGPLDRGYSLAFSSARIDLVAESFEEELDCMVRLAETEARVRRLGQEIQRTSRRVNALNQVVIPALRRDIRRIVQLLDEREREDTFRLKHLKRVRTHPAELL